MVPILVAALLPVLILAGFILYKDRARPEPPLQLLRAFTFGVLSVIPVLLFLSLWGEPLAEAVPSIRNAICDAFFLAAIPEELAKLAMLWLVLRRNPYFDEKMDGIVYAVCVSLGFAACENILYLFDNAENYMQVGITRALTAVPGHFCDGVLMGYYYSLAHFATRARLRNRILVLLAPVLAHGVYDSIIFTAGASEEWSLFLFVLFCIFCCQLWKLASRRMAAHLAADGVLERSALPRA